MIRNAWDQGAQGVRAVKWHCGNHFVTREKGRTSAAICPPGRVPVRDSTPSAAVDEVLPAGHPPACCLHGILPVGPGLETRSTVVWP